MIKEDVFPATVVLTAGDFPVAASALRSQPPTPDAAAISIARVVVSENHIWVVVDSVQGPMVVFEEDIKPATHHRGNSTTDSYVTTATGNNIAWLKDSACGCGSRLRSWRPYRSMSSSKDPGPDA